jgi:hypothetical protein
MGGISGFVNWGGVSAPTPLLAEAYLNGKIKLTQYYIEQTWRYITIFQFLFLPSILAIYSILGMFFIEMNMTNYILAIPFFYPTLIRNLQQPYTSFADSIQLGCNHPTQLMLLRFSEELLKLFFLALWVIWLKLPSKYGIDALIWILPCGEMPAILYKTITAYALINKRIVRLRMNAWQTLVVPMVSGLLIFGVVISILNFILPTLIIWMTFIPAIAVSILILIVVILFGYIPLTALLGGWDTLSLKEFRYAAQMSGPSKFFVWPVFRLTERVCRISPMFNRHPIDSTDALKEAQELLILKKEHDAQYMKAVPLH